MLLEILELVQEFQVVLPGVAHQCVDLVLVLIVQDDLQFDGHLFNQSRTRSLALLCSCIWIVPRFCLFYGHLRFYFFLLFFSMIDQILEDLIGVKAPPDLGRNVLSLVLCSCVKSIDCLLLVVDSFIPRDGVLTACSLLILVCLNVAFLFFRNFLDGSLEVIAWSRQLAAG